MYNKEILLKELQEYFHRNLDNQLALVIKGHLITEAMLEAFIEIDLKYPKKLFKLGSSITFAIKAKLVFAMGSILNKNARRCIWELNNLRDRFAHNLSYSLTAKDVKDVSFMEVDEVGEIDSKLADVVNILNVQIAQHMSYLVGYLMATLEDKTNQL